MKLEWFGKIELVEQEGGYASPQLYIGKDNITNFLWEYFGPNTEELFKIEGKWKLTLEGIEK